MGSTTVTGESSGTSATYFISVDSIKIIKKQFNG